MKIPTLFALVALTNARAPKKNDCEVIVNGIGHEKVILKEDTDRPHHLAINYNTNILYYCQWKRGAGASSFEARYLNLKTNESGTIPGIEGPFATAVDEKTSAVYFGGDDGIYKLNPDMKSATNLGIIKRNIWQMFAKGVLYFTTYMDEETYLYENGQFRNLTEIDDNKVIMIAEDNYGDIYFTNTSGLFCYTKQEGKIIRLSEQIVNAVTANTEGKLFYSTEKGIFSINEKTREVKILASINEIFGLAVESDGNFIYNTFHSIIRLKSTGTECSEQNLV